MLMARTSHGGYLNNWKGEDWQPVRVWYDWFPSGRTKCYKFPNGFIVKAKYCEVKEI